MNEQEEQAFEAIRASVEGQLEPTPKSIKRRTFQVTLPFDRGEHNALVQRVEFEDEEYAFVHVEMHIAESSASVLLNLETSDAIALGRALLDAAACEECRPESS